MNGGVGHVLGWEDIVEGRTYTTSAKCLTHTGILIKISALEFMKEIIKDKSLMNTIIDMSAVKNKMSLKHISNSS